MVAGGEVRVRQGFSLAVFCDRPLSKARGVHSVRRVGHWMKPTEHGGGVHPRGCSLTAHMVRVVELGAHYE